MNYDFAGFVCDQTAIRGCASCNLCRRRPGASCFSSWSLAVSDTSVIELNCLGSWELPGNWAPSFRASWGERDSSWGHLYFNSLVCRNCSLAQLQWFHGRSQALTCRFDSFILSPSSKLLQSFWPPSLQQNCINPGRRLLVPEQHLQSVSSRLFWLTQNRCYWLYITGVRVPNSCFVRVLSILLLSLLRLVFYTFLFCLYDI